MEILHYKIIFANPFYSLMRYKKCSLGNWNAAWYEMYKKGSLHVIYMTITMAMKAKVRGIRFEILMLRHSEKLC